MSDQTLTLSDLATLQVLAEAVQAGRRVRWAVNGDVTVVAEGVARHFVRDQNAGFLTDEDDVRDAYVRISGNAEYFVPVRELMDLVRNGLFAID